MKSHRSLGRVLAAATVLATASFGQPASACSLVRHSDNGRYLGGDLITQIGAKAEVIQVVRVRAKHIVTRTYSLGSWYLDTGEMDVPDRYPEYVDQFVFELEVIDTLKGTLASEPWLVDKAPRVLGYETTVFGSGAYPVPPPEGAPHPNRLPDWLFDGPAVAGYAFIGADDNAGLSGGECASPYFLEVGQTLIALRRSDGRLYPAGGGFPLEIDVDFANERGRRERGHLNMQSLIPITGSDDPLLDRLRQATVRAR